MSVPDHKTHAATRYRVHWRENGQDHQELFESKSTSYNDVRDAQVKATLFAQKVVGDRMGMYNLHVYVKEEYIYDEQIDKLTPEILRQRLAPERNYGVAIEPPEPTPEPKSSDHIKDLNDDIPF